MSKQKKAVFIGGRSRSGTTLLGSLLGGAKGCVTTPESQFITETAVKISRGEITETFQNIQKSFSNNFRLKLWGIDAEISSALRSVKTDPLTDLTWQCVNLYASKIGQKHWSTWIDHTPKNIMRINLLSDMFPDSCFIHIVRDGRGAFSSVRPLDWGPIGVIEGAKWWAMRVGFGIAAEQAFGQRIIRVYFEDLVKDPEDELKRICEFAGLEFRQSMLAGRSFEVPEYTRKQHNLIGKPPDKSVCDRWKTNLTTREVEIFESISGTLLEYLGYELIYGIKSRGPSRWEVYNELLFSRLFKKSLSSWRKYRRRRKF